MANPEAVDRSNGRIGGWLFAVARNLVVDAWRARSARPEIDSGRIDEMAGSLGVDDSERRLTAIVVRQAMQRLTPEQRNILYLIHYRQLSIQDAAAALDIPPGTVKSRAFYALRALRRALERTGANPT